MDIMLFYILVALACVISLYCLYRISKKVYYKYFCKWTTITISDGHGLEKGDELTVMGELNDPNSHYVVTGRVGGHTLNIKRKD